MATKEEFTNELNEILIQAKKLSLCSIEIISKELHNRIADDGENSMPNCCNAMKSIEKKNFTKMDVTHDVTSGQSTTVRVRYYL